MTGGTKKFTAGRPFANLDVAVKKLLAIADAMEADHAGRLHIGRINREFLNAGGSVAEYGAAVKAAIDRGYVEMHPSRLREIHASRRQPFCLMGSDGLQTAVRRESALPN